MALVSQEARAKTWVVGQGRGSVSRNGEDEDEKSNLMRSRDEL